MNQSKAYEIFTQLMANLAGVKYGTVSLSFKLHDGRVVEVTYLTAEQTKEPKKGLNKEN